MADLPVHVVRGPATETAPNATVEYSTGSRYTGELKKGRSDYLLIKIFTIEERKCCFLSEWKAVETTLSQLVQSMSEK